VYRRLISILVLLMLLDATGAGPVSARITQTDPIATTFIFPVGKPNVAPTWDPNNGNGYFITQGFNDSCDPSLDQGYYAYGLYYCGHTGIDLASQGLDANVHATAAGVVTEAQEDGGYGVTVRIRHLLPDGNYVYSQYEHMQYGSLQVYAGQTVAQGQVLGLVGATGFANGTHLHFEIKTIDAGGPGYTFGNQALIGPFFDPLAFVAAHSIRPLVLITASGKAIPEWPAEADTVLRKFLAQYKHYVVVDVASGLNVRSGPGVRFPTRGVALRGAKLGYIKTLGNWLYVALPQDVRGWVGRDLVMGYGYWDVPWPPKGRIGVIDTLALNIHASPGESNPVLGIAFQGDIVALSAATAHWTEVHTREGTRGWVLTKYIMKPGSVRSLGGGTKIVAEAPILHVRSGPGTQYSVTGSVFRGTAMQLIRVSPHWAAVILPGGTTGWVARSYTNLATKAKQGAAGGKHRTAKRPAARPAWFLRVDVSVVNIHNAPGIKHRVIARALRNTRLQILSFSTHWAHVALPASTIEGWVLRSLIH
jgi:murein DD-endopeptidase MepM/ murein hydrolase activator NlpD/SH3-like domain-containing protein